MIRSESQIAAMSATISEPEPSREAEKPAIQPSLAAQLRANALQYAPPLTLLTVVAAVCDVLVNRVAILGLADYYEATVLLEWARWGEFPRNLAAVSGLAVLLFSMGTYLGMRGFAPIHLRLPIAGFAGVLMPSITFATFTPKERLLGHLVLFGMFAANVLICLLALTVFSYRNRPMRVGLALAGATGLQALVLMTIMSVRIVMPDFGWSAAWISRHFGELTWLLTPLAFSAALIRPLRGGRARLGAGLGVLACAIGLGMGWWAEAHLHPNLSVVMYGMFRLAALPEPLVGLYAVIPAIVLGMGVFGMVDGDTWRGQLGAALILWIAAGYSPRSPIQLLYLVLAMLLVARVAQAADPVGVERSLRTWGSRSRRAAYSR